MMVVHLVAAALVALWLAYGERCLLAVLALTARLLLAARPSGARGRVPVVLRRGPPVADEVAEAFRVLLVGPTPSPGAAHLSSQPDHSLI